jgi:hypothetical protein
VRSGLEDTARLFAEDSIWQAAADLPEDVRYWFLLERAFWAAEFAKDADPYCTVLDALDRDFFLHPVYGAEDCIGRENELRQMPYTEYLQSSEWREVRKVAIARAGGRCQGCNIDGLLDVHHRTYERRGAEEIRDLVALCRTCHGRIHDKGEA